MICPNCRREIGDGADFCRWCGLPVAVQAPPAPAVNGMRPCPVCGGEISPTAVFCRHCGSRVPAVSLRQPTAQAVPEEPEKGKSYGGLRALLLVLCAALLAVGIWKVPGNVRELLREREAQETEDTEEGEEEESGTSASEKTSGRTDKKDKTEKTGEAEYGAGRGTEKRDLSAEYAAIDEAFEDGAPTTAEPEAPHPTYGWLYGDESGWEIGDGEEG